MALAVGGGLQGVFFIKRQSLRLDEARLALNVVSRSYLHLFPPLDHDQNAPILFLWVERFAVSIFGTNELALRVAPLLAGLGFLLLLPVIAGRLIGWTGAALATAMAASSPLVVNYSNQAKQYMVEAMVTVVLIAVAIEWLDRPGSKRWRVTLVITGLIAVWLAGPAVFILIGIVGAGLVNWGSERAGRKWFSIVSAAVWGIGFGLAYWLVYRTASSNPYMKHFWAPAFLNPTIPELPYRAFHAIGDVLWGYVAYEFDPRGPLADAYLLAYMTVILGIAAFGVRQVYRLGGLQAVFLCLGPVIGPVAGSVIGLYPLSPRLMLFAIPIFYLLVGGGVFAIVEWVAAPRRQLVLIMLGMLVVTPMLRLSVFLVSSGFASSPVRDLVADLRKQRRPGEPVYVSVQTIPQWTFYTTEWADPDRARLAWLEAQSRPGGHAFENAPSRGHPVAATEGMDLVWSSPQGIELLGLPSGMESFAVYKVRSAAPDSGWADHEAERIEEASNPGAWVLLTTTHQPEEVLIDALLRRGGQDTYRRTGRRFALVRFEFPDGGRSR